MNICAMTVAVVAVISLTWSNFARADDDACEIAKKACANTETGPHYQLIETIPRPASVVKEWKVTVESGNIRLENPFGVTQRSWEPIPPDKIYAKGFDITIRVSAKAEADTSSVGAGVSLMEGFGTNSELGRNIVDVAQAGQSVNDEATLHVNPNLPNAFAKQGDRVSIDLGGCDAGTMTYVYEYRE